MKHLHALVAFLLAPLPVVYSMTDGTEVGLDTGSPVRYGYEPPFRYDRRLDAVTFDLQ